jgi:cobalt/nickel transport system permease protein
VHTHEAVPQHRHPHHHTEGVVAGHEHAHATGYDALTYICSPIHNLDPRTKIASALAIVVAVVVGPPPRIEEFAALVSLLIAVGLLAKLPILRVLKRSALVLPFAGTIALFAPLQGDAGSLNVTGFATAYAAGGWIAAWAVLSKAWLSAFTMLLLAATTPPPQLFEGMARLRMPRIIVMLLSFIYRYVDVLRAQIVSMRRAIASRGYALSRWRTAKLYGHLAGSMFIRSYERGERVYASMLARGYTGLLPTTERLVFTVSDALAITTMLLASFALLLY